MERNTGPRLLCGSPETIPDFTREPVLCTLQNPKIFQADTFIFLNFFQQHIVSSCVSHNKLPTNVVALSNRNLVSFGDQKFKIMVLVGPLFFQRVWERILPWLSQFLVAVGIPGLIAASLQSLFSSRTLVIGFRAHTDHPGWSTHLEILNLIASVKTIFPNKVTFTSYRD